METPVSAWPTAELAAEPPALRPELALANAASLEAVMRQHNQRLYRLALSLVGNPDDAEDVLQESYFRSLSKARELAGRLRPQRLARKHRTEPRYRLSEGAP